MEQGNVMEKDATVSAKLDSREGSWTSDMWVFPNEEGGKKSTGKSVPGWGSQWEGPEVQKVQTHPQN